MAFFNREECELVRRGRKLRNAVAGERSRLEPFSGQTCLIEPAGGAPATVKRMSMPMAMPALQLHRGIRLSMAEQLLLLTSRA